MTALGALVVAGCTGGTLSACAHEATSVVEAPMISAEAAARAVQAASAPPAHAVRAHVASSDVPFVRGDRLGGHYVCGQGRTELTLVIEDIDGDDVGALFEFDYPGGGTTSPASGSFRMRGSIDPRSGALRLEGDRWIEQPDGYAMVGLVGTVSKSGSIAGTVKGPGCTTFYLDGPRRARSATR